MVKKQGNELSSEEKEVLRKFHEEKRKKLMEELSMVDSKLSRYATNQPELPFSDYAANLLMPEKMAIALEELGRFSTAREIFDKMVEHEPELVKDKETENAKYAHVSSTVVAKVKSGKYHRFKLNGLFKVGFSAWSDEKGEPLPNRI